MLTYVIRSEVSWVTWHVDLFGPHQRSPAQPCVIPANTKHLYNIYATSAQRLRRWSNIV